MAQKIGRCRFGELPDRTQRLFTGGVPTRDDVVVVPEKYVLSDLGCLPLWYFFALTLGFGATGWRIGNWALLFWIPMVVLSAKLLRGIPNTARIISQRRGGGGLCGLILDEEAMAVRVHDILRVDTCIYVPLDRLTNFWVGSEYNEGRGSNRSSTFMIEFTGTDGERQVVKVASSSTFEEPPRRLFALALEHTKELLGTWVEHRHGARITFKGDAEGGTGVLVHDVGGSEPLSFAFRWERAGHRAVNFEPLEGSAKEPKNLGATQEGLAPGWYRYELKRDSEGGKPFFRLRFEDKLAGSAFYDLRQLSPA